MSRAIIITLATAALAGQTAAAEKKGEIAELLSRTGGNQDIFQYDFGPPKSPAMTLLGLDADAAPPSTSLKAFVVSASNLFNGGGQSAAIDIAPAALFGAGTNFDDHAADGNYLYRLVRRTRFGVAALNGSNNAEPVQSGVSVGVSVSLLDNSDPLRANFGPGASGAPERLKQCILPPLSSLTALLQSAEFVKAAIAANPSISSANAASAKIQAAAAKPGATLQDRILAYNEAVALIFGVNSVGASNNPNNIGILGPNASPADVDAANKIIAPVIDAAIRGPLVQQAAQFDKRNDVRALNTQIEACASRASRLASFAADLDIGIGTFWRGKPGEIADLKNGGGALWAAFQLPLSNIQTQAATGKIGSVWMLGLSGRYGWQETIATGDKAVPDIRADTLNGWVGIERRSDSLLLSARYGYQEVRANDPIGKFYDRSGDRFLVQGQIRLGNDSPLWLGITYGNAGGTVDTYNAKRLLVNLAFSPPKPQNITGITD